MRPEGTSWHVAMHVCSSQPGAWIRPLIGSALNWLMAEYSWSLNSLQVVQAYNSHGACMAYNWPRQGHTMMEPCHCMQLCSREAVQAMPQFTNMHTAK